uniref:Uncharacterized protein n=1 Tax=Kalanchoe fedtschenkoi TaxID=63787 RepID=A0A7N0T5X3_KALFE
MIGPELSTRTRWPTLPSLALARGRQVMGRPSPSSLAPHQRRYAGRDSSILSCGFPWPPLILAPPGNGAPRWPRGIGGPTTHLDPCSASVPFPLPHSSRRRLESSLQDRFGGLGCHQLVPPATHDRPDLPARLQLKLIASTAAVLGLCRLTRYMVRLSFEWVVSCRLCLVITRSRAIGHSAAQLQKPASVATSFSVFRRNSAPSSPRLALRNACKEAL